MFDFSYIVPFTTTPSESTEIPVISSISLWVLDRVFMCICLLLMRLKLEREPTLSMHYEAQQPFIELSSGEAPTPAGTSMFTMWKTKVKHNWTMGIGHLWVGQLWFNGCGSYGKVNTWHLFMRYNNWRAAIALTILYMYCRGGTDHEIPLSHTYLPSDCQPSPFLHQNIFIPTWGKNSKHCKIIAVQIV